MERWTVTRAKAWRAERPWICGFNFLPSTAVNIIEMWHPETFDRPGVERELAWASGIGFNALRFNLHYLVWKHDRDGLLDRLDQVMGVAERLGMAAVPCLFDDCGFGGAEPVYGPQPPPVPGVHNSRAVASPGRAALLEKAGWGGFEAYVRDLVGVFRTDRRILFWDLYNEPGNRMIFTPDGARVHEPDIAQASHALMVAAFGWARSQAPDQPLTVGAWTTPPPGVADPPYRTGIDRAALRLSDVITFHAYWDTAHVERFIDHLARRGRPLFCTEWMARPIRSTVRGQLGLFHRRDVGCFQWGLVRGRTQTDLPWPAELIEAHGGHADRSMWFHDILKPDGRPYDAAEIGTITSLTAGTAGQRRRRRS